MFHHNEPVARRLMRGMNCVSSTDTSVMSLTVFFRASTAYPEIVSTQSKRTIDSNLFTNDGFIDSSEELQRRKEHLGVLRAPNQRHKFAKLERQGEEMKNGEWRKRYATSSAMASRISSSSESESTQEG